MQSWKYSTYSKINGEVRNHFPYETPRPDQLETVSEILEAIDEGYRFIVLEAGTGTGKSAIAATLADMLDDSYILTVTKQLQEQYVNDFPAFKLVKGRQNFRCLSCDDGCDFGKCLVEDYRCKFKSSIPPECPYYLQKFNAVNARTVVSNYHYMFLELNYVGDFQKRSLLVCDEAHNLESVLMNQLQLEFKRSELKEFLNFDLTDDILEKLNESRYTTWIGFIEKVRDIYITKLENTKDSEKIAQIKSRISDCNQFIVNITFDPKIWIFSWDEDSQSISFKPIRINSYSNMLFNHADVCLFMSATILDYKQFAKYLGISPDEIYPIRRKSPFNMSKSPIIPYKGYNLSRDYIKANAPRTLPIIREILKKHENDKGIIHTVSGKCRDYLTDNLKSPRIVGNDDIEEYKNSKEPLVLVSPSLDEGVDLPGDLCRFQIIYKIPYPDLGDKQIKTRMKLDSQWYDYRTSLKLIQTHGRGMRHIEDSCKTYVIDSRFTNYVVNNRILPDTFKNAIIPQNIDELVRKGEKLLKSNDFKGAVSFYAKLINEEVFVNDVYPYMTLSKIYRKMGIYDAEVNVIVRFLKSGITSGDDDMNYFKARLSELEEKGYFDFQILKETSKLL